MFDNLVFMSKIWFLLTLKNCSNELENAPDCIDFGLFFKNFRGGGEGKGGMAPDLPRLRICYADAPLTVPQGRTFLFFLSNQLQAMKPSVLVFEVHRVVRKLEFVQSFCCEVAWSKLKLLQQLIAHRKRRQKCLIGMVMTCLVIAVTGIAFGERGTDHILIILGLIGSCRICTTLLRFVHSVRWLYAYLFFERYFIFVVYNSAVGADWIRFTF